MDLIANFTKKLTNQFISWLTFEMENQNLPLCDFEKIRYELRPGDVILVEGRSRVSEVIKSITQSSWSHAALYIGRLVDIDDPTLRRLVADQMDGPPDTPLIIEGVMGKGTVVSPLTLYQKEHLRICRPRGLSHKDAQKVISYAISRLGTPYNVRQILDLLRFLMPWAILPRQYRSSLFATNIGHSSKIVCSSMLAEAFNSVEFPILPLVQKTASNGIELIRRNPRIHTPRDFDYSPYFDILKHPFIEIDETPAYRQLPWNRGGLISNDYLGIKEVKQTADFEGVTTDFHNETLKQPDAAASQQNDAGSKALNRKVSKLASFNILNFKKNLVASKETISEIKSRNSQSKPPEPPKDPN